MDCNDVFLRILASDDVSERYLRWMSDPDVLLYLESRFASFSLQSLRGYVEAVNASSRDILFGIFTRQDGHVGNVKIGGIDPVHRFGDLGILVGEPGARGRGIGTKAIVLATQYAFCDLNLNKLFAGIYAPNEPSRRAFEKAGYRQAGVLRQHRFFKGAFVDQIMMECLR